MAANTFKTKRARRVRKRRAGLIIFAIFFILFFGAIAAYAVYYLFINPNFENLPEIIQNLVENFAVRWHNAFLFSTTQINQQYIAQTENEASRIRVGGYELIFFFLIVALTLFCLFLPLIANSHNKRVGKLRYENKRTWARLMFFLNLFTTLYTTIIIVFVLLLYDYSISMYDSTNQFLANFAGVANKNVLYRIFYTVTYTFRVLIDFFFNIESTRNVAASGTFLFPGFSTVNASAIISLSIVWFGFNIIVDIFILSGPKDKVSGLKVLNSLYSNVLDEYVGEKEFIRYVPNEKKAIADSTPEDILSLENEEIDRLASGENIDGANLLTSGSSVGGNLLGAGSNHPDDNFNNNFDNNFDNNNSFNNNDNSFNGGGFDSGFGNNDFSQPAPAPDMGDVFVPPATNDDFGGGPTGPINPDEPIITTPAPEPFPGDEIPQQTPDIIVPEPAPEVTPEPAPEIITPEPAPEVTPEPVPEVTPEPIPSEEEPEVTPEPVPSEEEITPEPVPSDDVNNVFDDTLLAQEAKVNEAADAAQKASEEEPVAREIGRRDSKKKNSNEKYVVYRDKINSGEQIDDKDTTLREHKILSELEPTKLDEVVLEGIYKQDLNKILSELEPNRVDEIELPQLEGELVDSIDYDENEDNVDVLPGVDEVDTKPWDEESEPELVEDEEVEFEKTQDESPELEEISIDEPIDSEPVQSLDLSSDEEINQVQEEATTIAHNDYKEKEVTQNSSNEWNIPEYDPAKDEQNLIDENNINPIVNTSEEYISPIVSTTEEDIIPILNEEEEDLSLNLDEEQYPEEYDENYDNNGYDESYNEEYADSNEQYDNSQQEYNEEDYQYEDVNQDVQDNQQDYNQQEQYQQPVYEQEIQQPIEEPNQYVEEAPAYVPSEEASTLDLNLEGEPNNEVFTSGVVVDDDNVDAKQIPLDNNLNQKEVVSEDKNLYRYLKENEDVDLDEAPVFTSTGSDEEHRLPEDDFDYDGEGSFITYDLGDDDVVTKKPERRVASPEVKEEIEDKAEEKVLEPSLDEDNDFFLNLDSFDFGAEDAEKETVEEIPEEKEEFNPVFEADLHEEQNEMDQNPSFLVKDQEKSLADEEEKVEENVEEKPLVKPVAPVHPVSSGDINKQKITPVIPLARNTEEEKQEETKEKELEKISRPLHEISKVSKKPVIAPVQPRRVSFELSVYNIKTYSGDLTAEEAFTKGVTKVKPVAQPMIQKSTNVPSWKSRRDNAEVKKEGYVNISQNKSNLNADNKVPSETNESRLVKASSIREMLKAKQKEAEEQNVSPVEEKKADQATKPVVPIVPVSVVKKQIEEKENEEKAKEEAQNRENDKIKFVKPLRPVVTNERASIKPISPHKPVAPINPIKKPK